MNVIGSLFYIYLDSYRENLIREIALQNILSLKKTCKIALSGGSFQICCEQRCSLLASTLAQLLKIKYNYLSGNLHFSKQHMTDYKIRKRKTKKTRREKNLNSLKRRLFDPWQKIIKRKIQIQIQGTIPGLTKQNEKLYEFDSAAQVLNSFNGV